MSVIYFSCVLFSLGVACAGVGILFWGVASFACVKADILVKSAGLDKS